MLMLTLVGSLLAPTLLRGVARSIVFVVSLTIVVRADRIARAIYRSAGGREGPHFDYRPTAAERRLARAGLRLAIRQTELASMFPDTFGTAFRLARSDVATTKRGV